MNNHYTFGNRKTVMALTALIALFFVVLLICSPSVRGSDQYWYVGDIERVVTGDGVYRTNSVFPASMPEDVSELPRPWVQNKPVSYVVLLLTYITQNGHVAWLVFNTLCLFAAAFLTGRILRLASSNLVLFSAVFMFFPFNFYLATQALPEIFIMSLIAAIHYVLVREPLGYGKIALLSLITGILICHRPNYMLLVVFVPVLFYILYRRRSIIYSLIFVIASTLIGACSAFFHGHLIKSPSILETIAFNIQGKTNMGVFFPDPANKVPALGEMLPILMEKFLGAMKLQFEIIGFSSVMFYVVNLMLVGIPILLWQRKFKGANNAICLMFIAIHFATIILFYNQYRYAASIMPALFIILYQVWQNSKLQIKQNFLKYGLVAGCVVISLAIGYQVRRQAKDDQVLIAEFRQLSHQHEFDALMCTYDPAFSLVAGYALSPKLIYFYKSDISAAQWLAAAAKMNTGSGIINPKSKLYKQLKPQITTEAKIGGLPLVYFEIAR